jgi:superfamily II DNA/RNA helicase
MKAHFHVRDQEIYRILNIWAISELIIDKLYKNYQHPTVIQSISWPVALSGRDMISIAKTGTGKTLGFILPAIVHTMSQPARSHGEGPSVLVILPTRELALQVAEVALEFCKLMGLHLTCCYGGASKLGQANDLHRGSFTIYIIYMSYQYYICTT